MSMRGVYTAGIQTNPTANQILADTGPCEANDAHDMTMLVSTTVAGFVFLERRNAANDAVVWSHALPMAANTPLVVHVGNVIECLQGERFRLRLNAGVTGQVQGTLVLG